MDPDQAGERASFAPGARRFFELLGALVYRDVTSRYRKSVLGPGWAIVQPLMYLGIFTFLRGMTRVSDDGIPYPVFAFAALVPWTYFSNAVIGSAPSVVISASIVRKIAVPREVFPLAAVITSLFDLAMSGIVLAGLMVYYRVAVGVALLWLPLLVLLTTLLAFAVGMFLASLGTFKRDLVMAAPFLMQFWLFASPVMYSMDQVPARWRGLYVLNPAAGLIEGYRNVLVRAQAPPFEPLLWSLLGVTVLLALVWPLFRWISQYFADAV